MSVDLGIFHTERPHSDEDAAERYMALCAEKDTKPWLEPSPSIALFYDDLAGRFGGGEVPADPWAAWPADRSDGHVILNMRASEFGKARPIVVELAEKHGLVCFDPQIGQIVTAPPGIHVAETEPTAEDPAQEEKLGISPFVEFVDSLLKQRGFKKQRRIWRHERENSIAVLEMEKEESSFEIHLCVWLKAKGEIEARQVKPFGGLWHIQIFRLDDILPERLAYRLYRAADRGGDFCEYVLNRRYNTEEEINRIAPYFEPMEPLTWEWREAVLREVIEDQVIPWFDAIEANPRDYYGWGRFRKWLMSKFGRRNTAGNGA